MPDRTGNLSGGSKPMGSHFGVGAPILEPILVGIESDVHWGYDSDFEPWPSGGGLLRVGRGQGQGPEAQLLRRLAS